jgi:hypothetical protein
MSATAEAPQYLFIVGMPRTGTTLMRRVLNRSPEVSLGGESHFFGAPFRLRFWTNHDFRHRIAQGGGLATEEGVSRFVDHVYRIRKRNFWGWIAANVDREAFRQAILDSDRSERAVLEIVLALHGQGRRVRGEKTPANIHAVPVLVDWFPGAKVIHTFRDPRAIFASLRRKGQNRGRWWRGGGLPVVGLVIDLYSSLRLILSWHQAVRLDRRYRRDYPDQYLLLRYEDLVADPASTIPRLCAFVGIEFVDEMLDQTTRNSSFRAADELRGFDVAAVDRWRGLIDPLVIRWFDVWCGRQLRAFGYPP